MYLRNIGTSRQIHISVQYLTKIFKYILFFIFMLFAIMLSSITDAEASEISLLDSLNNPGIIYFDFGKSELKQECFDMLDRLADILKNDRALSIEITGHTDNIGSDDFNYNLSVLRAESVMQYLVNKGVNKDQVFVKGRGFSEPKTENTDEQGRAQNRRVEFVMNKPLTTTLHASEPNESFVNTGSWKSEGNEVTGQLSVRDSTGEPITDVSENDITALLKWQNNNIEDSAGGSVKLFPIDDKKKIAFTFIMDYSGSMFDDSVSRFPQKSAAVIQMEKAVLTFIENMKPEFYGRIIKFGMDIRELVRFTKSRNSLRDAVVNYSENLFSTALYKSIWFALNDTTFNSNPSIMKTVIAFTDGEENASGNIKKEHIFKESDKSGVRVYTVGLLEESKHSIPAGIKKTGEADLVEIAKNTGGFYYWAQDPLALPMIYSQIYNQIIKSYNISILWSGDNLPPKGTQVTAVLSINYKGTKRIIHKPYVMD